MGGSSPSGKTLVDRMKTVREAYYSRSCCSVPPYFKDKIKYVIFVYGNEFEIIRLENIPYLLDLMPWDYYIHPLIAGKVASVGNICVLGILPKEE